MLILNSMYNYNIKLVDLKWLNCSTREYFKNALNCACIQSSDFNEASKQNLLCQCCVHNTFIFSFSSCDFVSSLFHDKSLRFIEFFVSDFGSLPYLVSLFFWLGVAPDKIVVGSGQGLAYSVTACWYVFYVAWYSDLVKMNNPQNPI